MMRFKTLALSAALLVSACGDNDPTGPGSNLPNGNVTATVDGAAFNAIAAFVGVEDGEASILISDGDNLFLIGLVGTSPGGYSYSVVSPNFASFTTAANLSWQTFMGEGIGQVNITTFTSTRIVGNFSFLMVPLAGTGATGDKSVNGTFDLTYQSVGGAQ